MTDSPSAIAGLPMYDFPEIRASTDAVWRALRDGLRAAGVEAPDTLTRPDDLGAHWRDPRLVLSQTCGLPLATVLDGRVVCLGALGYHGIGCAPGFYRSALVVRRGASYRSIADLLGARAAINEPGSQSGRAALQIAVSPHARNGRFFDAVVMSGGHRASIRAVASGAADIAAIDGVTWCLACRHEPAAQDLRVLSWTPETPGLPLITSLAHRDDVARLRQAIGQAVADLDEAVRAATLIADFIPRDAADYRVLPERLARHPLDAFADLAP